jgi:histone H3/H4
MYNYSLYIRKVLRQVHPDTTITKDALSQVNSMINTVCNRLAQKASKLAVYSNHKTIREEEIHSAVRLIIPGGLRRHAISEGTGALVKFNDGRKKGRRAGIEFSISRVESQLRKNACNKCRVGKNASVYLAAVLNYLSAEILELAGNVARDHRPRTPRRITVRDLMLAVKEDGELTSLFRRRVFVGGGVKPNINYFLL